jgi:hypothetical protein
MAFFDSSISRFHIDDTAGASRDLSANITEIEGIPGSRSLTEITSLSDEGPVYIVGAGLKPALTTVTLTGIFDDSPSGADAVLSALLSHPSPVEFSYAPAGTSHGSVKYSGMCWVERYEVSSRAGERVGFTATLRVEGSITRAVHTN